MELSEDERKQLDMAAVSCGLTPPSTSPEKGDLLESLKWLMAPTVMTITASGEYEFSDDPEVAEHVACLKRTLESVPETEEVKP